MLRQEAFFLKQNLSAVFADLYKVGTKSQALKKMSKIEAHKAIFATLKDEMQNKIHALEIEIK